MQQGLAARRGSLLMERLLARLERRFGKHAISGLPIVIPVGMAAVFVLGMLQHNFEFLLVLDPARILGHGGAKFPEVWRLFTYLLIPQSTSPIWAFFEIAFTWMILNNLESAWGAFRLNAYYLVGMICTTLVAFFVGGAVGSLWLNLSVLLAFATLFPDYEIYVFLILPLRVKWLALGLVAFTLFQALGAPLYVWASLAAGLANYVLFCGPILVDRLRGRGRVMQAAARRAAHETEKRESIRPTGGRTCAICGAKEDEGADIRVCSCEKCGGKPRTLCLEHARNH